MLQRLMGFAAIVAGAVLALASHWLIGLAVLIVGVLLATSARRNATLTSDSGSGPGYDSGSSWSGSGSDWNSSGNGNDGHRDCNDGGGDCGGGDGGGD